MKVAPFRALTHPLFDITLCHLLCRNEGRPFQGIDTMNSDHDDVNEIGRNEGRPFQGIDTFLQ